MGPLRLAFPDPSDGPWELSATVVAGSGPVLVSVRFGRAGSESWSRTVTVEAKVPGHDPLNPVSLANEFREAAERVEAPLPPAAAVVRFFLAARREGLREHLRRAVRRARDLSTDDIMAAVGEVLAEEVMRS